MVILVNKYFGPSVNAAYTIGGNVSSHTNSLSASLMTAFSPAVTNAYGAGDRKCAISLAERMSKFGTVLLLLFAVPLSIEIDEVLLLWLKNPPKYAMGLCVIILAICVCEKLTSGYATLVSAEGKVAAYNLAYGLALAFAFPLAWIFVASGRNIYWVAGTGFIVEVLVGGCRLYFARKYVGISICHWARRILFPICLSIGICVLVGLLPRMVMAQSFLRVVLTGALTTFALVSVSLGISFDADERKYIFSKFNRMFPSWLQKFSLV